jgi:class 3 adenylate cyclase/CHASE2 domain-containing sensor protein
MRRHQATVPILITVTMIALVALCEWLPSWSKSTWWLKRLEWVTYDLRTKLAADRVPAEDFINSPFGFVLITDSSIRVISDGTLGYQFGLYWPRQLHGHVTEELAKEGASAAAFDVIFAEKRTDQTMRLSDGTEVPSDQVFVDALQKTGIGILASTEGIMPAPLFRQAAASIADISAQPDGDGVLRRARPYRDYPRLWHSELVRWAYQGANLDKAVFEPGRIVVPGMPGNPTTYYVQLDEAGHYSLTNDDGTVVSYGVAPFESLRVWHMGLQLAARRLGLDLSRAVERPGELFIPGTNGVDRTIPLEPDGTFLINWRASLNQTESVFSESFDRLLAKRLLRGMGDPVDNSWSNRLAIIGSKATGNDLTDRGATPLHPHDYLVAKHWNIADMILKNRFIREPGTAASITLIAFMAVAAALITWRLKALEAALAVAALCSVYVAVAVWLFLKTGWWVPIVLPVLGGMIGNYVALVTYRFRMEQNEKRRVKSVFSKIVSPNVVNELLNTANLNFGGERRKITVYFSDVRGFTAFMDAREKETDAHIRDNALPETEADAYRDEQAAKNLKTINSYLATIADTVKRHDGTLDKYMGDCVMAFWGAPKQQDDNALRAVRAAIESQRAIEALNDLSREENRRRTEDNARRVAEGLPPLPELPEISLGTGINTGFVTVGLMGSDAHILNYTVFGSEVNLASRLEGFSGRGRIIIGRATFQELERTDPALAATCLPVEVKGLKGFTGGITAYEVPWRTPVPA